TSVSAGEIFRLTGTSAGFTNFASGAFSGTSVKSASASASKAGDAPFPCAISTAGEAAPAAVGSSAITFCSSHPAQNQSAILIRASVIPVEIWVFIIHFRTARRARLAPLNQPGFLYYIGL